MVEIDSEYVEKKKNNLISIVNKYNNRLRENDPDYFAVDENNLDIGKTFCSDELCRKCGACCKYSPCVFSPNDFLEIKNVTYMKGILDTGLIGLFFYGNGHIILRPRGLGNDPYIASNIQHVSYEKKYLNPCVLLGENGCMLPDEYRPSEGLLHYEVDHDLYQHVEMYSQKDYLEDYEQYKKYLWKLAEKYKKVYRPIDEFQGEKLKNSVEDLVKKLSAK